MLPRLPRRLVSSASLLGSRLHQQPQPQETFTDCCYSAVHSLLQQYTANYLCSHSSPSTTSPSPGELSCYTKRHIQVVQNKLVLQPLLWACVCTSSSSIDAKNLIWICSQLFGVILYTDIRTERKHMLLRCRRQQGRASIKLFVTDPLNQFMQWPTPAARSMSPKRGQDSAGVLLLINKLLLVEPGYYWDE